MKFYRQGREVGECNENLEFTFLDDEFQGTVELIKSKGGLRLGPADDYAPTNISEQMYKFPLNLDVLVSSLFLRGYSCDINELPWMKK